MPEKTQPSLSTTPRLALLSFIVVALGVVIYLLIHRTPGQPANTNQAPARIAAVTPESYTMVSGTITSLDPETKSAQIDFTYIDPTGKNKTKKYTVTADDKTLLQSINQSTTPATVTTVTFDALVVGDRIDALSNDNIAPVDHFTATTILQYSR